jgi:hypothetical protein
VSSLVIPIYFTLLNNILLIKPIKTMQNGSAEHKAQFIEDIKKECHENIWRNELHLTRLSIELSLLTAEMDKLDKQLAEKGKPPANTENKQKFILTQNIEAKMKEVATVEQTKKSNEFILSDLLPRFEAE